MMLRGVASGRLSAMTARLRPWRNCRVCVPGSALRRFSMTADGPPRCLWRIRDCALSCRLFPFAGGGLRFCNIVEAPRDSGGAFFLRCCCSDCTFFVPFVWRRICPSPLCYLSSRLLTPSFASCPKMMKNSDKKSSKVWLLAD